MGIMNVHCQRVWICLIEECSSDAFLSTRDVRSGTSVIIQNLTSDLSARSINILPDCKIVVFNTAKVSCWFSLVAWRLIDLALNCYPSSSVHNQHFVYCMIIFWIFLFLSRIIFLGYERDYVRGLSGQVLSFGKHLVVYWSREIGHQAKVMKHPQKWRGWKPRRYHGESAEK